MNKKVGWKIIVLALIVAVGVYYWVVIRPAQIRFACHQQGGGYGALYEACLSKQGISTQGLVRDYK